MRNTLVATGCRAILLSVKKIRDERGWCWRRFLVGRRHGGRFSRFRGMRGRLRNGPQSRDDLFHVGIARARFFLHEALDHRSQGLRHGRVHISDRVRLLGAMSLELVGRAAFKLQPAGQAEIQDTTQTLLIPGWRSLSAIQNTLWADAV